MTSNNQQQQAKWKSVIHCIVDEKKSVDNENELMRRTPMSKAAFDKFVFRTYSSPADINLLYLVHAISFDGKTLLLETNNDDAARHVREHFEALLPYLRDAFGNSLEDLQVTVVTYNAEDPINIWSQVKEKLASEMPRASFDTWVQDTQALSFEEGVLTVGVRNAYARDWLGSRVKSTVAHLLTGILNTDVQVDFVVGQDADTVENVIEQDEETSTGESMEPMDLTRYRDEVHPDHVVMLDGYCLRLLEYGDMTPKEMSLWVGFRQSIYRQNKAGKGTIRNVPHYEVMRFAMMSRAAFFRELKEAKNIGGRKFVAGGHVEILPENAYGDSYANRYRVLTSPLLSRHDCAVIETMLLADVAMTTTHNDAKQVVLQTLDNLAKHDPVDWINQDVDVHEDQPRYIQDIVRCILEIKGDLSEDLAAACEKLYDRISNAFGKVFITHYFLRVVVPALKLTHAQTWAIIVLRDKCWFDHATGTQKEFALVRGGIATAARWIGVTMKSFEGWMRKPEFKAFIRIATIEKLEVPEEWHKTNTQIFLVQQQEPLISEALDTDTEKVRLTFGKSETLDRKKRDSLLEKMRLGLGKSETLLNNLNKPLLNPNKPQETQPVKNVPKKAQPVALVGAGNRSFWDFDFLMDNNQVNPGSRKNLLRNNKTKWGRDLATLSAGFVSWILYAYSPEGVQIKNPVGLAVKRLNENAYAGAHGGYDKLARLTPYALRALFDADLSEAELGDSLEANIYQTTFSRLQRPYKQELYGRLFGFTEY